MTSPGHRGVEVPGVRAPAGNFVHARLAWRNAERTLAAAGFTLDDVVKVNMYIRDRRFREQNRTVRNEVLGDRRPALTVLVTDHWDDRWLIEIEVIAARRPSALSEEL